MEWPVKEIISGTHGLAQLRDEIGSPSVRARRKVISVIDEHCCQFIAKSPFLILSTANQSGHCDASPRGDAPGFVSVIDEQHLFIPERPGNMRLDSLENILDNPNVGLLFMIPGLGETLRVNGRAAITRDAKWLEHSMVNGRVPSFGIVVKVEECYVHCAKALIRSNLWDQEEWLMQDSLPHIPSMMADHVRLEEMTKERIERDLQEGYQTRLY
ncbi:pyridoxamine 5'-phosphate oxidase-like FMN-binding protein [Fictibacillus macauensis ZFHKF-1]|uniref:Pyridoxamine 5'-phosphate oxidase-like FMN-binding protein n=1 Tax=Fictibacillus macauensis ZFHKF-1 TaxID=1196324 RepID=I8UFS6_9BACL|nr:pyridoxamine 5'-phosphate oxidase family protein [Fictibacillus macauensis]EIT85673.1 pyridoxamine 5'-phosphate oxidase-like FMN-binding protein [Fictibacillus macauensis ZFHKF-1]